MSRISFAASLLALSACVSSQQGWHREPAQGSSADAEKEWQVVLDGSSLLSWAATDSLAFQLREGGLTARGPASAIYYRGSIPYYELHNFELEMDVRTSRSATAAVYVRTHWHPYGQPLEGYAVRINNSLDRPGFTGGVNGIQDNPERVARDSRWFNLRIRVENDRVTTFVDGRMVVDQATSKALPDGIRSRAQTGTIAIANPGGQGEVRYRNVRVRVLPG